MASHHPKLLGPQGTKAPDPLLVWKVLMGTLTGLAWSVGPQVNPGLGVGTSPRDFYAQETRVLSKHPIYFHPYNFSSVSVGIALPGMKRTIRFRCGVWKEGDVSLEDGSRPVTQGGGGKEIMTVSSECL